MQKLMAVAAAALYFTAPVSHAQSRETVGTMRIVFENKTYELPVLQVRHEGQLISTATVRDGIVPIKSLQGMKQLDISGMIEQDGAGMALTMMDLYRGKPAKEKFSNLVSNPYLAFYPQGVKPPFWSSDSDGPQIVSFDYSRFEFDGKSGHVAGTFSGKLCRVERMGQSEPDTNDCRDVSGSFDTKILAEDR